MSLLNLNTRSKITPRIFGIIMIRKTFAFEKEGLGKGKVKAIKGSPDQKFMLGLFEKSQ